MTTYGKLQRAELSTGGLIVQCGTIAWAATATVSANISTPLTYVLGASFVAKTAKKASGTAYIKTTAAVSGGNLAINRKGGCSNATWVYTLIGY